MQDRHAKIVGYIGEGEAPVEEEPAPPTAGQAPPESERGVFADYSYGRLLKSCLDEALAGALRVRWGAAEVLLYFQDGRPVGVRSNYIPEVSLAQVLIDAGAISRSQAEEAFEHARRHGVLVGEALIDLRRIGPNKLHEALARQAKDKAILPFGFERAQYELRRGPVVGERLQTIEQPLALLALEGVVRHMKDERVRRPFAGKERRVFTFDPASRLRLEDLGLGENELAFLRAAAKGMTLEEALALRRLPPARVYQLLYTLILLGAFRFRKTERESRVAPPDPATLSPADLAVDAEANLRAGAFEKAAAIYREALARDKDLDEAWIGLGRALNSMPYEKRGGTSPEDCFVRAAEIDRRNPTPYLELARLFKQATLWRKAIDYYERALERDPANAEAQRELKLAKMRLRAEV
jgi:tetratricopeptide (TPR) repeat protein